MIAFLSTHLSFRHVWDLSLPPFPQETLSPLTNIAKFDIGVEIKKALHSHKFHGNWWLFRRHWVSRGILKISASGEEKAAASFQCYLLKQYSACWKDVVRVCPVKMWHGIDPLLPHGFSVVRVHTRCCRGAWAQVRQCGRGMEGFWRWEWSKRTWWRGYCSEKVWPQGINL